MTLYTSKDHAFVICAYKENPHLPECVESLLSQESKSDVYMVTSTPNDYISNICEKNNIPLFVNTGDKGLAQDWNFAVDTATAAEKRLITIAHQDDVYDPDYLTTILALVNKSKKPLIAYTEYYEIRNGEKIFSNKLLRIKRFMNFLLRFRIFQKSKKIRRMILSIGDPICCPAVTFACENLTIPMFDINFVTACDYKAWVDFSLYKGDFLYSKKQLMGHRIHPDSATSANIINNSKAEEDFIIFSSFWPKWIARILSRQYRKAEKSNEID